MGPSNMMIRISSDFLCNLKQYGRTEFTLEYSQELKRVSSTRKELLLFLQWDSIDYPVPVNRPEPNVNSRMVYCTTAFKHQFNQVAVT